jgi:hypothetical protein
MNLKKLIREEIDAFDWADDVTSPEYNVGDKVKVKHPSGQGRMPYDGVIEKVITPSERMSYTNPEYFNLLYRIKLYLSNGMDAGSYYSDGTDIVS